MGTVKAVLRRRLIAIQPYLKKQDKSQINNLTLHLNQLEMKNPRVSRRKEILKIRAEINEKETTEIVREHLTGGFLCAVSHKSCTVSGNRNEQNSTPFPALGS